MLAAPPGTGEMPICLGCVDLDLASHQNGREPCAVPLVRQSLSQALSH